MTWLTVGLLVVAVALSTTGAVAAREERGDGAVEARARRAIVGLESMAAALALAAASGALLGAGRTGRAQLVAFAAVAAAVALPLLVVRLAGARRRSRREHRLEAPQLPG